MWRRCVLIVFVDTNSSAAISGARRLRRQVSDDAQLGLTELIEQRRRLALDALGARAGEHVEDGPPQRGVRRAVTGQAFEDGPRRREDERQDDALRLGQLERRLQRCLRRARVTELFAGNRVEHLRLRHRG